mmetsp:Transcript_5849/g.19379  ORF Transcript_5849/g.19379 Transcript_5849/m.19379 type:complete len:235 (+) Transcript_5849:946-1650(+)
MAFRTSVNRWANTRRNRRELQSSEFSFSKNSPTIAASRFTTNASPSDKHNARIVLEPLVRRNDGVGTLVSSGTCPVATAFSAFSVFVVSSKANRASSRKNAPTNARATTSKSHSLLPKRASTWSARFVTTSSWLDRFHNTAWKDEEGFDFVFVVVFMVGCGCVVSSVSSPRPRINRRAFAGAVSKSARYHRSASACVAVCCVFGGLFGGLWIRFTDLDSPVSFAISVSSSSLES